MSVYVIAKDERPLMPCSEAKAKHLLDKGIAKVKRRTPFTTSKNASFCRSYEAKLSNQPTFIKLPLNLEGLLIAENMSNFKASRYYLSNEQKSLYQDILRACKVGDKLLELGIVHHNTTLLFGESGTGKTTFARYLAYKMDLPLFYMNFSQIISSLMGATAKNISKVFSYVAQIPCVFMLDELDAVCGKRSTNGVQGADGETSRITITMMQELDKLNNRQIVLGATNRIDCIDAAIFRRFNVKQEFRPLRDDERISFVQQFLSDIDIPFTDDEVSQIAHASDNASALTDAIIQQISEKIEQSMLK